MNYDLDINITLTVSVDELKAITRALGKSHTDYHLFTQFIALLERINKL